MFKIRHLIALFLLFTPATSRATELNDRCLERCSIATDSKGMQQVRCSCTGKSRLERFWNDQRPEYHKQKMAYLRKRLGDFSAESYRTVQNDTCKSRLGLNSLELRNSKEAESAYSISTMSLCECVENRLRLPLNKQCFRSRAGERFCQYSLNKNILPARNPLRALTLMDFQACEADKNSYRRPASCRESTCHVSFPKCSAGYELTNLADDGSCCPRFLCKKIEESQFSLRKNKVDL